MSGGDHAEENEPAPGLDEAYAVQTPEDNRRLYARWAATYDEDFIEGSGYVYPRNVAAVHAGVWPGGPAVAGTGLEEPILDVGCGTGAVGVELRLLGARSVDGIDLSPEMLAKAAEKTDRDGSVYRNLRQVDLTSDHDLPGPGFGGVVSAGTFTHGHLGPEPLVRLVGNAAPGTRFTIGVNGVHFVEHGFEDRLLGLEQTGRITAPEMVLIPMYVEADPADLDRFSQVAVFTVR